MTLPNNPIAIELVSPTDADALAVLQYVQYACPTANLAALPSPQGSSYSGDATELVLRVARPGVYSGLGLVAAAALVTEAADGWGLAAAALKSSVTGTYVTPTQVRAACRVLWGSGRAAAGIQFFGTLGLVDEAGGAGSSETTWRETELRVTFVDCGGKRRPQPPCAPNPSPLPSLLLGRPPPPWTPPPAPPPAVRALWPTLTAGRWTSSWRPWSRWARWACPQTPPGTGGASR